MVLAIECDGASYHSSETARDRDRLRQEQLERLGWRFHRIWSQDWFTNKERETEKALAAYEAAVAAANTQDETDTGEDTDEGMLGRMVAPTPFVVPSLDADGTAPPPARAPRPAVYRGRPITDYTQAQLQAIVRWIESDTLLRTREELIEEVMRDLGFLRHGKRIDAAIKRAIASERRGY